MSKILRFPPKLRLISDRTQEERETLDFRWRCYEKARGK